MRLSIVIPAWCEAETIERAVRRALAIGDEVIVADAQSPDGTGALAAHAGARVVQAPKGRGPQLRAGAAAATGDVLLFLHADAELAEAARAAIERRLRDPSVVGGNFLLRFEGNTLFARFYSRANDLRRRWFRIYYGDSAIFVRRATYDAIGGIAPLPLFEDYEFVRRLERCGRTAYVRDVLVEVSSRRFADAPLATLATWAVLHGFYSIFDVSPERLVGLYRDVRERADHLRAALR